MAWQHFSPQKNEVLRVPPAALAASAALHPSSPPSAANAASAAEARPKNRIESAAIAASAAGVHPKTAISPAVPLEEVALLFERIMRALMEGGATRLEAGEMALPVMRSRLSNDPRIAPARPGASLCAICGEPEALGGTLLIPVLTGTPNGHAWLHTGECHDAYRAEIAAKVDGLIAMVIGS